MVLIRRGEQVGAGWLRRWKRRRGSMALKGGDSDRHVREEEKEEKVKGQDGGPVQWGREERGKGRGSWASTQF